ncbi:hypothetical protein IE077_002425 [Cardiosporidium cionae]|uniref:Centrosomal protein of 44 kDa n=1 Tax=Cardiosporidium cionae TaxID=476202 RepID=A0ABQ7JB22_9APIC|nr:hypothetical protein IE077_002425 [Cardiosporidium cionae]|eukprot:KAF8821145.1 hypothetical protein IE077_002425 [Cardiosporidium cionae]
MSTGDLKGNVIKLTDRLRLVKYPMLEGDKDGIIRGHPPVYLKILHFIFYKFSGHFREFLAEKKHFLYYISDLNFLRGVYKVFRQEFDYRPAISIEQFLTSGAFIVRRILMCYDLIGIARGVHNQRLRRSKQSDLKLKTFRSKRTKARWSSCCSDSAIQKGRVDDISQIEMSKAHRARSISPCRMEGAYSLNTARKLPTLTHPSPHATPEKKRSVGRKNQSEALHFSSSCPKPSTGIEKTCVVTQCKTSDSNVPAGEEKSFIQAATNAIEHMASFENRFNKIASQLSSCVDTIHGNMKLIEARMKRIEENLSFPPLSQSFETVDLRMNSQSTAFPTTAKFSALSNCTPFKDVTYDNENSEKFCASTPSFTEWSNSERRNSSPKHLQYDSAENVSAVIPHVFNKHAHAELNSDLRRTAPNLLNQLEVDHHLRDSVSKISAKIASIKSALSSACQLPKQSDNSSSIYGKLSRKNAAALDLEKDLNQNGNVDIEKEINNRTRSDLGTLQLNIDNDRKKSSQGSKKLGLQGKADLRCQSIEIERFSPEQSLKSSSCTENIHFMMKRTPAFGLDLSSESDNAMHFSGHRQDGFSYDKDLQKLIRFVNVNAV